MQKLKSERHHWWPKCVSKHWANQDGFAHLMTPDGVSRRVPPAKLGMIGNGHHIKLSKDPADGSPWDTSFEAEFDIADHNFPGIISWLSGLSKFECFTRPPMLRFAAQDCTNDQLTMLTECVVSLAVRSPGSREQYVSVAEHLRGALPTPERNMLIGLNMRNAQRMISDSIGCNAKFVVLYSTGKEFIYGDGFFHNVSGLTAPPLYPSILAPITPTISVLITRPFSYSAEPRLSTFVLTDREVEACNHAVQVYSQAALFYREEKPELIEDFTCNQHRQYEGPDHPIDTFIRSIPGVLSKTPYVEFS
ncbi:hypothetical protein KTQ74_09915 [Pseudomonas chlororaphis]|uniref:hypothetical protein n=1 Tax=Pseudomonas chlororaphis TaxID=587753 RepID=UPI001E2A2F9D|nr:hypothetical protein [Pseudomonas chlororaphis]MCB2252212.1 hypothetical protein [Pseudomonas chlororaphis]